MTLNVKAVDLGHYSTSFGTEFHGKCHLFQHREARRFSTDFVVEEHYVALLQYNKGHYDVRKSVRVVASEHSTELGTGTAR